VSVTISSSTETPLVASRSAFACDKMADRSSVFCAELALR
jgi:hypothetical protein